METTKSFKANSEIDSKAASDAGYDTKVGSPEKGETVSGVRGWLKKLSVETGGIERVTDEDRQTNTSKVWNACTFWLSANMAVATLSTGMVGGSMGLAFWDCFAIIVVVNLLSCLLPAWTASLGLSGLRMTTFSRYSFGYWGNLLVVVFSIVSTTGWNAINSISGASCLYALSDGKVPTWAGVIIICTTVWLICALGITWIHRLDAFLWIPPTIVWCVAAGTGAKNFHGAAIKSPTGANGAASALSFMAVVFSFAVSWVNCAADYNVRMPVNTPRSKIFFATYAGILIPTVLVQTLGAALYSGTELNKSWKLAYLDAGVGGPLQKALEPAGGFGKFLMVLAALSAIPNNIPNNYSFAMHAQNFGPWAVRIPRIILVTFGFIAAIIVGCFAAKYFHDTLQTFLSIIGYWTIIHIVVVAEEHLIFRANRWSRYDFDAWDKPALLPFGWGAIAAFCFGFLGAAMGMKVAWYDAPIAGLIGKKGANIGHELTAAFSGLAFPVFRWLEKKYTGK
ncbi:purine-cytosine permease FCY2 [Mytilinidion resinicola]|uniref:Purine-cytosine permease FCY2 n=1 Tax=Mytilinidion resinicola TaxID=574789 RepID=A0A6A6YEL2_9PEZI|nr:purine-cytosine permease FCY2 [Mytilinidion resinicola]KAF2806963.1 purine-cytosine permease FCY2 [Mytilinidion resinicola]